MRRARSFSLILLVLFIPVALTGCFVVPPVTFTVPVDAGQTFGPTPLIPAGTQVEDYEVVTSNFIGLNQIYALAEQQLGGFLAGFIEIDRIELLDTTVTATRGSFSTLEAISLALRVTGSERTYLTALGSESDPGGLGTMFTLTPEVPIDLVYALNPGNEQPPPSLTQLAATVTGSMPEQPVTFNIDARLRVSVRVSIF